MFTIKEFTALWQSETKATVTIFEALTNEALDTKFNENVRTPGMLANHLVRTIGEMGAAAGLPVTERTGTLATAKELANAYTEEADKLLAAVEENWTDESMSDEITLFGETWTKGFTLISLVAHQCHHRGQMTVLMRLAGLKVPGVYGPAKEEWAAIGMEAPKE